jgi:hypothetical protein
MTSTESIAQIKDIVLIIFLVFSFALLLFGAVLSVRLYLRVNRFMDRMEHVAEGFEDTFGRVAVARQAVEEAASVLKPVAKGLGLVGAFQGVGKLFGGGGSNDDKSEANRNR